VLLLSEGKQLATTKLKGLFLEIRKAALLKSSNVLSKNEKYSWNGWKQEMMPPLFLSNVYVVGLAI
jgi:hypothetical protein